MWRTWLQSCARRSFRAHSAAWRYVSMCRTCSSQLRSCWQWWLRCGPGWRRDVPERTQPVLAAWQGSWRGIDNYRRRDVRDVARHQWRAIHVAPALPTILASARSIVRWMTTLLVGLCGGRLLLGLLGLEWSGVESAVRLASSVSAPGWNSTAWVRTSRSLSLSLSDAAVYVPGVQSIAIRLVRRCEVVVVEVAVRSRRPAGALVWFGPWRGPGSRNPASGKGNLHVDDINRRAALVLCCALLSSALLGSPLLSSALLRLGLLLRYMPLLLARSRPVFLPDRCGSSVPPSSFLFLFLSPAPRALVSGVDVVRSANVLDVHIPLVLILSSSVARFVS